MDTLELLTRGSIWLSVAAWAWVVASRLRGRGLDAARVVWSVGIGLYVIHAILAFERFYDWSHATALAETARQTAESTGFESGSGLWLNYLLGLVWIVDAVYWWSAGTERYLARPRWARWGLDAFLVFMIFNGTVVFGKGAVQWFGGVIFVILAALAVRPSWRT